MPIIHRAPLWTKRTVSLDAATSTVVDSTDKDNYHRGEFILSFDSNTLGRKSLRCSVNHDKGNVLTDTVYSKLGASIDIEITAQINGTQVELVCTNNEAHTVTLRMARLVI